MALSGFYPTFAGIQTFMRAPYDLHPTGKNAIVGVPYDLGTSNRAGAREAPAAIRKMSLTFDADRDVQFPSKQFIFENLVDAGDVLIDPGRPLVSIANGLGDLIVDGNKLFILGGDHSITLQSLRAHSRKYGKMALLHFDAHPDTWPDDNGGHGSFVTTAVKEGLLDTDHIVQIGLRTVGDDDVAWSEYQINALQYKRKKAMKAIKYLVQSGIPIYMTFDVDCLDPAFAPGTGTPVCGGLSNMQVLKLLRYAKYAYGLNPVGMDVVEVCPAYDHAGITALAAATVIQQMLQ